MTKRKFLSPAEWEAIYQDWISSDLSMTEFCSQTCIAPQSLYNYRQRRETPKQKKSQNKSSFVELGSLAESHGKFNSPLEIVLNLGDGIELTIRRAS